MPTKRSVKKAKRKPDGLTAKQQKNGDETLWFDDSLDSREKGGVISHGPGHDFLSITLIDEHGPRRDVFVMLQRPLVKKLLPYLAAFADGGDFGVIGEKVL